MYTYKILLHKEPEGGFTVTVPVLPGCITYGEDVDESIAMAREAIELYIEGSHQLFHNATTGKTIVVPVHGGKDLKKGTFLAILRQAGIKI